MVAVALKLALLVAFFDPVSAEAFDGAKGTLSLALAAVLAGLLMVAVLRHRGSIVVRAPVHLAAGALVLANLLAAAFAEDRYTALFGAQRHVGFSFVFDMALLYAAIALACRTGRDWAILGGAVLASGTAAIAYGFVQYAGLDPIPWSELLRQRPPSTFGNPDKFGHFLGASFVTAAAIAAGASSVTRREVRLAAMAYALIALASIALIATRGTLVGIAAGLPVVGLLQWQRTPMPQSPRNVRVAVGALLGLVVLGMAVLFATPLGERLRGGFADVATQQRLYSADAAIRAFRDRPLLGYGPDTFGTIYPRYRPPGSASGTGVVDQDSAHSSVLQAAATTGALGTLAYLAFVGVTALSLWRVRAGWPPVAGPLLAGAVAYWAQGLVAIGSPSVDWMGWLAAGAAATYGRRPADAPAQRLPAMAAAVPLVLGLMLAAATLPALQADRELNTARAALRAGRADRAVGPAERAVQLDGGRAEHWYVLGLARHQPKTVPGAAAAFREATNRAPSVSRYWSSLAAALYDLARAGDRSLGGAETALAAAERATQVDYYSPSVHYSRALIAAGLGDDRTALSAVVTAIGLDPSVTVYDAVAAETAVRVTDLAFARASLEGALERKDSPVMRVALARILLKVNERGAARSQLRRALDTDPQNAAARELLGQLGP